jgi:hypothetical protein
VRLSPAVGDRKRHHFVEDQDDAEALGHVSQALDELGRCSDHPGGSLDRLEQNRSDARRLPLENLFGAFRVIERNLDEFVHDARMDAGRHLLRRDGDCRAAGNHVVRMAVIATSRLRELRPPRVRACEPHR